MAASTNGTGTTRASVSTASTCLLKGVRLTSIAQQQWKEFARQGDVVVDATAGNGHDTLWLVDAVGASGQIHAFDTEEQALASTLMKLEDKVEEHRRPKIFYHHSCHSKMQDFVDQRSASLICFNLGYLPCADGKAETATKQDTTVAAVRAALQVVSSRGLVSILAYIGHPGGQQEYEAVRQLLQELDPNEWTVSEYKLVNRPSAPVLLSVASKQSASA